MRILLTILTALILLIGCSRHPSSNFVTDAKLLSKYLGLSMPLPADEVRLFAFDRGDPKWVDLRARFTISKANLMRLVTELDLKQNQTAVSIVPPLPPGAQAGYDLSWWNPPAIEIQWNYSDRYYKFVPTDDNMNTEISLLWIEGTAYIYMNGYYK